MRKDGGWTDTVAGCNTGDRCPGRDERSGCLESQDHLLEKAGHLIDYYPCESWSLLRAVTDRCQVFH